MTSTATNPQDYLESLPEDRKAVVRQLRDTISKNIDPQFEEIMSYGMITWVVPHSVYPAGYHVDPKQPLPFFSLANQKNYIALYHMGLYTDSKTLDWFTAQYAMTGHKLDMGKSCIRFKKPDQIPYELIGQLAAKISLPDYLNMYTSTLTHQ